MPLQFIIITISYELQYNWQGGKSMEIIKRTGQKETFRSEKIADAIAAAFKSVGTEVSAVKALTAEITE